MQLRTRIMFFGVASLVLVAAIVAMPLVLMNHLLQQQMDNLIANDYNNTWNSALNAAGTSVWLQAHGTHLVSSQLPDIKNRVTDVARVDYVDKNLKIFFSTAISATQAPLVNPEIMLREVGRLDEVVGLVLTQGGTGRNEIWFAVSKPHAKGGFVTVAAKPTVLESFLKTGISGHFFITDTASQLLASSDASLWKDAQPFLKTNAGVLRQHITGVLYMVATVPINDYTGYRVGSLHVLQDITFATQRELFWWIVAGIFTFVLLFFLLVVLHSMLSLALQPLAEVSRTIDAIAQGDIFAPLSAQPQQDEVGEIAKAVAVFQSHAVSLAQRDFSEQARLHGMRYLIDAEMKKITQVLQPAEQEALQVELQQVLQTAAVKDDSSLALSFQLVTARVVQQQTHLSSLLAERSADLALVRQALSERTQLNRLLEELELASQLQSASLPRAQEAAKLQPWLDLNAQMRPAKEVGGDFYDYLMLDDRHLMLVVGDASGKGISAAMFVLMTRTLLRANVSLHKSLAQSLFETNNALERDNQAMIFTTVFLGILDLHTGQLEYSNAGHNPPYVVHQNGSVRRLDGAAGVMLGVMPNFAYENEITVISPGDLMLLYSDGITEAHNPMQVLFSEEKMVQVLSTHAQSEAETLVNQLFIQVDSFAESAEQFDDMTVLACRFQRSMGA